MIIYLIEKKENISISYELYLKTKQKITSLLFNKKITFQNNNRYKVTKINNLDSLKIVLDSI